MRPKQSIPCLLLSAALLAASASRAFASEYTTQQTIIQIENYEPSPGWVIVVFDASRTVGPFPTCNNNGPKNKLIFDSTTTPGKTLLTIIMSAYLSGRKIKAKGNGTNCGSTSNIETLSYLNTY